jgi:hypothetical protein
MTNPPTRQTISEKTGARNRDGEAAQGATQCGSLPDHRREPAAQNRPPLVGLVETIAPPCSAVRACAPECVMGSYVECTDQPGRPAGAKRAESVSVDTH